MPEARVELARGCPRGILSPLRLPFRHSGPTSKRQLSASVSPVTAPGLLGREFLNVQDFEARLRPPRPEEFTEPASTTLEGANGPIAAVGQS
jgi:hypothetical protein